VKVRLGDLREIGRAGVVWRPRPDGSIVIVPSSVRNKAIRIFHEEGAGRAIEYLEGRRAGAQGLGGTFGPSGNRATQGRRTREAFDRYVRMSDADGRDYADVGVSGDVEIGSHVVGVTLDAVVFDTQGYAGRLLTWDLSGMTSELALLVAGPAVLLIDQQMGRGTCCEVEVWDLEHDHQWRFLRAHALSAIADVERVLDAVESAIAQ
jgi:hypothetical protein